MCDDVHTAPPACTNTVTTVASFSLEAAYYKPLCEVGEVVLYLASLLQGTMVAYITNHSFSPVGMVPSRKDKMSH